MKIERRFTKDGQSPYADIAFRLTTSEIRNPDGSVVFRAENVEVPESWSQVASDVLAQKYFRKAGVPARLKKVEEETVPSWLWRSVADETALADLPEKERVIGEVSCKQVFDRLAGTWTYWGWKGGYFDSEADAQAFFDEHRYMLASADVRAELAAMVQHRPALGLRHRRPEPGPLLRRLQDRQADQVEDLVRASAAARLLHPVDQ
jgi:ribonucleoside-diphosphate reductase alpha chain